MVDLYALPPEEFTAARDAAAKADRGLRSLRRPTVSAWVLNTLVRRDGAVLDRLTALGAELSAAQAAGDGDAVRRLGHRRRELVEQVAERAVSLVQRSVSDAVRAEVVATLEAVVADPTSAEAVRSGQLLRPLSFAGFGGVDLQGAVASAPRPAATEADATPRKRSSAGDLDQGTRPADEPGDAARARAAPLERTALKAAGALDDAVGQAGLAAQALESAEAAVAGAAQLELDATRARDAATAALEQAREALARAETEQARAQGQHVEAVQAREAASAAAQLATDGLDAAQRAAEAARQALDAHRRRP